MATFQGFLLNKKQREAAATGAVPPPGTPGFNRSKQWGESSSSTPAPHPYHMNPLVTAKYDDDFPLRKTGMYRKHSHDGIAIHSGGTLNLLIPFIFILHLSNCFFVPFLIFSFLVVIFSHYSTR